MLEQTQEKERQAYSLAEDIAGTRGFLLYNIPKDYVEDVNAAY
ncbi:hypothetical protein MHH33_17620 [Paenisporosarcina sp. FSL H8-0542]|nr:hypothetical protein [Paenisporosarcina sp. HGH0030]